MISLSACIMIEIYSKEGHVKVVGYHGLWEFSRLFLLLRGQIYSCGCWSGSAKQSLTAVMLFLFVFLR